MASCASSRRCPSCFLCIAIFPDQHIAHISPIPPQVPVVLFPVGFGVEGARSIGIRAFITRDFMTGTPAMPGTPDLPLEAVNEISTRILAEVPGIARVAIDISPKPPATTEWE